MSQTQPWTFFSLPFEIRLAIYHAALTSPAPIAIPKAPTTRTLAPILLRTCKRIHAEAHSLLYTSNIFALDTKWPSLRFLQGIKPTNVGMLKRIHLDVSSDYDGGHTINHIHYTGPMWCELLKKLADEATGLAYLRVYFNVYEKGGRKWGAGNDASFFKALSQVRVKKGGRVEIDGFFMDDWKVWLQEHMELDRPVWVEEGKSEDYLSSLEGYRKRSA